MVKPNRVDEALAERSDAYKSLQKHCEQLERRLERLKASKWKLPISRASKARGNFRRVIIPDTHGQHVEPAALSAMLSDLEEINPSEVILLGDHLDCGGFLSLKHTLGFVAEMGDNFEDDVNAANQFLDAVQKRAPKAAIYYLEGNHEHRIEAWCVTAARNNESDARYLLKAHAFYNVLSLEKRGIQYRLISVPPDHKGHPGSIKLGDCWFTHGPFCGRGSAVTTMRRFRSNVVFGHTHQIINDVDDAVEGGPTGGWSVGCLCRKRRYWNHTRPTNWTHAFGCQIVRQSGRFQHITVPIVDGDSLMRGFWNGDKKL